MANTSLLQPDFATMPKTSLITGTSRGLGKALAIALLERGQRVLGCARGVSDIEHKDYHHARIDLAKLDDIEPKISTLTRCASDLEYVILNAGLLGEIKTLSAATVTEFKAVMDVNVWANMHLLASLLKDGRPVSTVVMISSGAAINGYKGWGGYCVSKAALNMLCQLYAEEYADTHFVALAPGLVDTDMQAYLCETGKFDAQQFPSLGRLRSVRDSGEMPNPDEVARHILDQLPQIVSTTQSGSFVDIRNLD